jgi:hypothetical protein
MDRTGRVAAWREAARVLRTGGVAVAATISDFAGLFDSFIRGYVTDPRFRDLLDHTLASEPFRASS